MQSMTAVTAPNTHSQDSPLLLSIGNQSNSFHSTFSKSKSKSNDKSVSEIYHDADKLTKRLISILKWAPFRFSNTFYIIGVAAMILFKGSYTTWLIFTDQDRFCPMLGWLMLSFQIESLILYFYAYLNVDMEFMTDLSKLLAVSMDDEQPIKTFKWHISYATSIVIFSYLSGYLILAETPSDLNSWKYTEIFVNVFDVFRYIPQIFHIALVTLFYSTFPKQINKLRTKWSIPDSRTKVELDQLLSHKPLEISHHELKCQFEKIIRPYYLITRKGKTIAWIMNYLFLNLITMAFWWISVLSDSCRGNKMDIYYTHYAIELLSFFIGWVYVIFPFYSNQKKLSELVDDIRKITHVDTQQYIAIMIYLDGLLTKSPVSISGYKVTSYQLVKILLIVFGSVLFDVVAEFKQIKIF